MTDEQKKQKLKSLFEECKKEADEAEVKYSKYIKLEISKRAKSRYGLCEKKGPNSYIITISDFVFDSPDNKIKQVILHEMVHTCKGCMNHGSHWKAVANQLNRKYGYEIHRTNAREEMGLPSRSESPVYKYAVECQACKKIIYRQKMSQIISHPERFRCKCGGIIKRVK